MLSIDFNDRDPIDRSIGAPDHEVGSGSRTDAPGIVLLAEAAIARFRAREELQNTIRGIQSPIVETQTAEYNAVQK